MKRSFLSLIAVVAAGLLATSISAQPNAGMGAGPSPNPNPGICDSGGPHGPQMGARHNHMGNRGNAKVALQRILALDLTSEQATRVRAIQQNVEKQIIPKRATLEVKRIELRELMHQTNVNQRAVTNKLKEINDVRGEIAQLRVNAQLEARGVLTGEQLERYLDPTWRPETSQCRKNTPARRR